MKKKMFCIFFATLMLLSAFPMLVFASTTKEEPEYVDLSKTDIRYDFEYLFAGQYDVDDYKEDKSVTDLSLITCLESKDSEGNWELYFYVYNPSRLVVSNNLSKKVLNMAKYTNELGMDDDSKNNYDNYYYSYVCSYDDTINDESNWTTDGLIIKYRVPTTFNCSDTIKRYYRIAELQPIISGEETARSYTIGKEYCFWNKTVLSDGKEYSYMFYDTNDLTVVDLDAYHTFYRVNTEGINCYTDIQSVYFPVPNELLKLYGSLDYMKVKWDTYKLNNSLATSDTTMVYRFEDWMHGTNPYYSSFNYSVVYEDYSLGEPLFFCGYNVEKMEDFATFLQPSPISTCFGSHAVAGYKGKKYDYDEKNKILGDFTAPSESVYDFPLSLVFYSDNLDSYEEKIVDGKDIISFLNKYHWNSSMYNSKEQHSQIFNVKLDENKSSNSLQVYEKCDGWLSAFWNAGWYDKSTDDFVNFDTFFQINVEDFETLTAEELSKKYLVDEGDTICNFGLCGECMRCRFKDKKYNDCTWFLLRYDTTEYKSNEALICDNSKGVTQKACVFNIEAINNYDIISVKFAGGTEFCPNEGPVFPVGRSPSQYSPDAWSPEYTPTIDDLIKSPFEKFMEWVENFLIPFLQKAFIALCIILVVCIIVPFIPKRVKIKVDKGKDKENE